MSANRKVIINSALHSLTFVIPTIVLLVLTPYFVSRVGEEGYGIWMLSYSILGLAGALELGMGLASTKYIAEYSVERDIAGISTIFTANLITYLLIGAVVGIFLFFLAPDLGGWIKVSPEYKPTAVSAIQIVSFAIWPSLAIGAFAGIPRGLQSYAVPSLINILLSTGAPIGALIILSISSYDILAIISWVVLLHWLLFLFSIYYAWQVLKPFQIRLGISRQHLRKFLNFSAYSAISNIGGKIFTSGDRLFVGIFLGATAVTYYSVAISLANKPFYLVGYLTQSLLPRVSELSKTQAEGEIASLFRTGTHLIGLISLGSGALLFALSETILNVWMGPSFSAHTLTAFRLMLVIYAVLGITPVGYYVANGYGFPRVAALGAFTGGLLAVILMLPLTYWFSLQGAALANLGYWLSFAPMFALLRNFRQPIFKTVWQTLGIPLLLFIGSVAATLLLQKTEVGILILSTAIISCFGYLFLREYSELLKSGLNQLGLMLKRIS